MGPPPPRPPLGIPPEGIPLPGIPPIIMPLSPEELTWI